MLGNSMTMFSYEIGYCVSYKCINTMCVQPFTSRNKQCQIKRAQGQVLRAEAGQVTLLFMTAVQTQLLAG